MREIIATIFFYVLRSGCDRRLRPKGFPPWETAYRWFTRRRDDGPREATKYDTLVRERIEREASPSAAMLDRESPRTTEAGGPRGYVADGKIVGGKHRALVDTDGRAA